MVLLVKGPHCENQCIQQQVDGEIYNGQIRLTTLNLLINLNFNGQEMGEERDMTHDTIKMQSAKSSIWENLQKKMTQSSTSRCHEEKPRGNCHRLREIKRPFGVVIQTTYLFFKIEKLNKIW